MSIDIDFLSETWLALKEYIPSRERQAAADHMLSLLADYNLSDKEIKTFSKTDGYIKRAVDDYFDDENDEDYEEDED